MTEILTPETLPVAEPTVINNGGKLVVSSRNVAAVFEKEHRNVLRDVENVLTNCSEEFRLLNFEQSTYLNDQNHEMPEYILTKDGLTMLVMGYTGQKAMEAF